MSARVKEPQPRQQGQLHNSGCVLSDVLTKHSQCPEPDLTLKAHSEVNSMPVVALSALVGVSLGANFVVKKLNLTAAQIQRNCALNYKLREAERRPIRTCPQHAGIRGAACCARSWQGVLSAVRSCRLKPESANLQASLLASRRTSCVPAASCSDSTFAPDPNLLSLAGIE